MKKISRPKKVSKAKTLPTIKLGFYKKRTCWYAKLDQGTEAQNMMVGGCETMLDLLSNGGKKVTLEFTLHPPKCKPLIACELIAHNAHGGTYQATSDIKGVPETLWVCNQTHCLLGEHPQNIYVLKAFGEVEGK